MSEKFVTLAAFHMPVEAQLARGRLEAEGIKAFLTGGGSVDLFGGIQGVGGLIDLQVSEADAERAAEILAAHEDERHGSDGDAVADDTALWLCPLCGDAVGDDLNVCSSCETPRPAPRKSPAITAVPRHNPASQEVQEQAAAKSDKVTSDTPLEAVPSAVEDDLDLPDMETLVGDDLVRRAFLCALFGALFFPITLYSLWLVGRLALYPGKISPRLMPRFYWALLIDAFVCVGWLLLLFRGVFLL